VTLAFVAWSPSRLGREPPAEIEAAQRYLQDVDRYVRGVVLFAATWSPTPKHFPRLEFVARHRSPRWLRESFEASFAESAYSLFRDKPAGLEAAVPPADYAEAVGRLLSLSPADASTPALAERVRQLRHTVQQFQERSVIEPLMREALRTPDPGQRGLWMLMATLSRICLTQGTALGEQIGRACGKQGGRATDGIPEEKIAKWLAIAAKTVSVAREIRQWEETSTAQPPPRRRAGMPDRASLFGSN
jgi:hypothetical protein